MATEKVQVSEGIRSEAPPVASKSTDSAMKMVSYRDQSAYHSHLAEVGGDRFFPIRATLHTVA